MLLAAIVRVLDVVALHPAAVFAAVAGTPVALAGTGFRAAALVAAGVLLAFGSFATPGFLSSGFLCGFLCHSLCSFPCHRSLLI